MRPLFLVPIEDSAKAQEYAERNGLACGLAYAGLALCVLAWMLMPAARPRGRVVRLLVPDGSGGLGVEKPGGPPDDDAPEAAPPLPN